MRRLAPCVLLAFLLAAPLALADGLAPAPTRAAPTLTASTPAGPVALAAAAPPAAPEVRAPRQLAHHAAAERTLQDYATIGASAGESPHADITTRDEAPPASNLVPATVPGVGLHAATDGGARTAGERRAGGDAERELMRDARDVASPPRVLPSAPSLARHAQQLAPETLGSALAAPPASPSARASDAAGSSPARVASASTTPARPPASAAPPWARAAAIAAGASLVLLAPLALYHRMRGARTLEQGARARIGALLRERPGLTQGEIAREVGLDASTVRYHLHRLAKEGLVADAPRTPQRAGRYFAPGTVAPEERVRVAASLESGRVLDAVRAAPGCSVKDLMDRLALGRTAVAWHLRKLAGARLVILERDGRLLRVRPSP